MFTSVYWIITGAAAVAAVSLTIYAAWHQKSNTAYLCDNCRFNDPQSCKKPERPTAIECTSYRKKES